MRRKASLISRETEAAHAERLRRKKEKLDMLRTLLSVWENEPKKDPEYLKKLHYKTERLQSQLDVMAI